jgi:chromosome segregation ATPase
MNLIAINLSWVAFVALPLGAITLGVTIYFFLKSRESLKQALEGNSFESKPVKKQRPVKEVKKEPSPTSFRRSSLVDLEEQFARMRYEASASREEQAAVPKKQIASDEHLVQDMKETIAQQQKLLTGYLQKIEQVEHDGREELVQQNNTLQKEITKLHGIIEKKDEEIEEVQQQASTAHKMAAKIEEVYQEFDQLQEKMSALEKQANRANNLAIDLEDVRHSYEQVHKELQRKQEKLEEVMNENQRMRLEMNTLEDKLAEANLQRQQLQKKVQFLQELNTDMQSISDTNKKLQTELRRIGELESMLNMMAEERDYLLRRKSDR